MKRCTCGTHLYSTGAGQWWRSEESRAVMWVGVCPSCSHDWYSHSLCALVDLAHESKSFKSNLSVAGRGWALCRNITWLASMMFDWPLPVLSHVCQDVFYRLRHEPEPVVCLVDIFSSAPVMWHVCVFKVNHQLGFVGSRLSVVFILSNTVLYRSGCSCCCRWGPSPVQTEVNSCTSKPPVWF